MRYPDGGGLTAKSRSRREQVRLQAAQMFARDMGAGQIAGLLCVSAKPVYWWRRDWRAGGEAALASTGPGGNAGKLGGGQLARLRNVLDAGRGVYGWDRDQRWTLARVAQLIPDSGDITINRTQLLGCLGGSELLRTATPKMVG